jgi:hexosaminidase
MTRSSTLSIFFVLLAFVHVSDALWPAPRGTYQSGKAVLPLSESFDITLSDSLNAKAGEDLRQAVSTAKVHVANDKLGPLIVGRGSSDRPAVQKASQKLSKLELSLGNRSCNHVTAVIAQEVNQLIENRDESYTLSIPGDSSGIATLSACTALGLYRGIQTFTQLVYTLPCEKGSSAMERYIRNAPIYIEDSPAFPLRGLMMDTSRNFYPIDSLKRHIEAASWLKFNTFHWYHPLLALLSLRNMEIHG